MKKSAKDSKTMRLDGGCLCGANRYFAEGDPVAAGACHCRDCQYASGGGPAHVLVYPATSVVITKGSPAAYAVLSQAGNKVSRFFCSECGTQLFRRGSIRPQYTIVTAGSLDDPRGYTPAGHVWTRSAQPWHAIDAALPCHPGEPAAL